MPENPKTVRPVFKDEAGFSYHLEEIGQTGKFGRRYLDWPMPKWVECPLFDSNDKPVLNQNGKPKTIWMR